MIQEILKYCLLLAVILPGAAEAARPMITDDARVVDPRSCQLESWVRHNRSSTEYWALPGCNVGERLELTVGGARGSGASGSQTTDVVMQAKYLLRTMQPDGWGLAATVGNVSHPAIDARGNLLGDQYLNVPASFSFRQDAFVLHLNGGWLHERRSDNDRATWGVGSETRLHSRHYLIAETYGQAGLAPFYQVGWRFWLVPGRIQIDATTGGDTAQGGDGRWLSTGIRLLSPAFLP